MTKGKHWRRCLCMVCCLLLGLSVASLPSLKVSLSSHALHKVDIPAWIEPALIEVDGASRRGVALEAFRDIVVHYVGNPGSTARANRNWFNSSNSTVSSHFVVGLDGEILQCVPLWERSSASNHRNKDTISIEVCHPDDTGQFNDKTYASLVKLTAWLVRVGNLDTDHVIRHHDVTGKECPRWFVREPQEWEIFKENVKKEMEKSQKPS